MKIEHLEERITDYKKSVEAVIEKKIFWQEFTKPLLLKTLENVTSKYKIGWKVQELN
jgi:hypothetical protein